MTTAAERAEEKKIGEATREAAYLKHDIVKVSMGSYRVAATCFDKRRYTRMGDTLLKRQQPMTMRQVYSYSWVHVNVRGCKAMTIAQLRAPSPFTVTQRPNRGS